MKTVVIGSRGYIGSALMQHIEADEIEPIHHDYWDVEDYDTIILLAGHPSMQMGRDDPVGAWRNNVIRFEELVRELRDDQRLIYASSASVYNGIPGHPTEECTTIMPENMYDLSKFVIDQIARVYNKHTYGIRLCTVNGYSPVLRVDLMLNKMVEATKNDGVVKIKNASLERPLTGMQDVCRGIKAIIESTEDHRGVYNFNSLRGYTVKDYADAVVAMYGGVVEDLGDEFHYVYGADTTKFEQTYNFKFTETLESILESLKQEPERKVIRALHL